MLGDIAPVIGKSFPFKYRPSACNIAASESKLAMYWAGFKSVALYLP
jgi:hypothetical protein